MRITGAERIIGRAPIQRLGELPDASLRASVRRSNTAIASAVEVCVTGDLSPETGRTDALVGVFIHLAAHVPMLRADANPGYAPHC